MSHREVTVTTRELRLDTATNSGLFSVGADQEGSYGTTRECDGTARVDDGGRRGNVGRRRGDVQCSRCDDGSGAADVVDAMTVQGVADGRVVFEVVLNQSTGGYTFTLKDQLDHHAVADADDSEGYLNLELSGTMTVQDEDGDEQGLDASSVVITVQDDVPVETSSSEQGYVEEEALADGNQDTDDHASMNADGDDNNAVWSSSIAGLFSVGADQEGSYSIDASVDGTAVLTTEGDAVTSDGDAVTYNVVDATTVQGVADGRVVFEVVLNQSTGGYTFTLKDQLDHHAVADADDSEGYLNLELSGTMTVQDEDGDEQGLDASSVVITVQDDVPVETSSSEQGYVEEEALADGNQDTDDHASMNADGDDNNAVWSHVT